MTERELEEYRALRATIRQRGTVRIGAFVAGFGLWAAVLVATTFVMVPLVTLVPLVLLAGTFEAVYSLHLAVERVGRYLQVFYEDQWEATAMAFGPPPAGTRTDPLFTLFFGLATLCNFIPVALAEPVRIELAVLGGAHAVFAARMVVARRAAARQRRAELARFQQMKAERV